ncbi:hypothetical protein ASF82_09210 [Frigoribacterium sp. Leaf164]|nr:hypothetical protein ASF82_09210 [Frigoribacterium sp. Leaf164]
MHALGEGDRHLDDAEAGLQRPPEQVDLEAVAARLDLVEVDAPEGLGPEGPEAAGGVGDRDAEGAAGVPAAAAAEQPAAQRPVLDAAAGHPARAEHEVVVGEQGDQGGKVLRVVGAVGVHLDEGRVAALEPPGEAGQVRGAEAGLAGAVQHVHPGVAGGPRVGEVAGAVGRAVVDDENVDGGPAVEGAADDPVEVLSFVVGRDDDECVVHGVVLPGRVGGSGSGRGRCGAVRGGAVRVVRAGQVADTRSANTMRLST